MESHWINELFSQTKVFDDFRTEEIASMQSDEVVIFGAGATSTQVLEQLLALGINPVAFCDNNPHKAGQSIDGLPIISFTQLCSAHRRAFIYISVQLYYREILQQLLSHGFNRNKISNHDIIIQLPWEKEFDSYFIKNADAFNALYTALADEASQDVLRRRCAFLLSRRRDFLSEIHRPNQYFEPDFIKTGSDEVFADIGTFTGDTIEGYIEFCNGVYGHIYGFEPEAKMFQQASSNLVGVPRLSLVPMGTASCNAEVPVSSTLGLMQSIAKDTFHGEADGVFQVCRLDDFFSDKPSPPTFMKMDIEGAELDTLNGAAGLITQNCPQMAICVYHKHDDLLAISAYLRECCPDYKLYLRHYSDNSTETVLYAV
ncbi:MAG: FkbM family methyltransferase [Desulfobulbus sp.]|jgi:FkbM family methyltransferase